jgi:hypothetical protein
MNSIDLFSRPLRDALRAAFAEDDARLAGWAFCRISERPKSIPERARCAIAEARNRLRACWRILRYGDDV